MTCGTHKNIIKNWRYSKGGFAFNDNKTFRLLENVFWHYKQIKKEVEEIRSEMSYYQSQKNDGGGSSNRAFVSDPTASTAMKMTEKIPKIVIDSGKLTEETIVNPEDWLIVVEQTMNYMNAEEFVGEVLRRRFFRNEPMATTCIDLEIDKNKYYAFRDIGLRFAKECAIQLGLIRVFFNEPHSRKP